MVRIARRLPANPAEIEYPQASGCVRLTYRHLQFLHNIADQVHCHACRVLFQRHQPVY